VATTAGPVADEAIAVVKHRAYRVRRLILEMSRGKGEGYTAQGLGIADCLAALYFHELRHDPANPSWPDRDRFLLSTGHYSIALYAVLAEAGYLDPAELPSYGLNASRLPMSTFDDLPGVEIVGGSLGQGLGQAVGMALGLRLDGSPARVFCELSDGELEEGSTWEAAMAGASFGCAGLVALVDCNGIQADGPVTAAIEPVAGKFEAFGWRTAEIDGNDPAALLGALDWARTPTGGPTAIVLRTTPGHGVPTLVARPRAHFVRIADGEWAGLVAELEANRGL
jgi:transketolase